ncbi:MAG: CDP-alcohol phosphatidyltransferase family protein [Clostridia bacterium]|nr:CDP-alcohol phosphatidyltransferase family protein [Clostridia bacterium]
MKLIGYYNRSVYLTYLSGVVSVVGVVLALEEKVGAALTCLMLSGLFDMLDGTVAAHTERSAEARKFGIQIDSLCDIFCFCVFPALLCYQLGATSWWSVAAMSLLIVCGIIRLGYFNVQEELRQQQTTEKRKSYQGLPVTSTSLIFPLALLILDRFPLPYGIALPVLMTAVACAFVLDIPVVKPQGKGKLLLVAAGVVLFLGLIFS